MTYASIFESFFRGTQVVKSVSGSAIIHTVTAGKNFHLQVYASSHFANSSSELIVKNASGVVQYKLTFCDNVSAYIFMGHSLIYPIVIPAGWSIEFSTSSSTAIGFIKGVEVDA